MAKPPLSPAITPVILIQRNTCLDQTYTFPYGTDLTPYDYTLYSLYTLIEYFRRVAFIASVRVTDKWKGARAMSFAQTAGARATEEKGDADDKAVESANNSKGNGEENI